MPPMQRVRSAFERKGYGPNAYIDKKDYMRTLNSIVGQSEQFFQEVAQELWAQAAGDRPSRQLRVQEICKTIVQAQNILKSRIKDTNDQIQSLQFEKRRLQSNTSSQGIRRIQQIDIKLQELYTDKQSFEQDYKLVTEPFGLHMPSSQVRQDSYRPAAAGGSPEHYSHVDDYEQQAQQQVYQGYKESQELKLNLYLTLIFGILQIIMIYGKPDFLNLIVLTCLLSIYLMNFFDRKYIRLTLALIIASIALDLVWLIMYAGPKWSPDTVSNSTIYQLGYMRFIVFFTIALIPLKLGLILFLFKHRNAETNQKYVVSIGLMKILLSANRSNPISKGLAHNNELSI